MDEEEAVEEAELADGEVGRVHGLAALEARDADADLGLHDHVHVVRAVADRERHGLARDVRLDEEDELGLLLGRHAAREHGLVRREEPEEHDLDAVARGEELRDRAAVEDDRAFARTAWPSTSWVMSSSQSMNCIWAIFAKSKVT